LSNLLKVEHKTIRRAIQRGEIKAMKLGKQWRIKKSDIQ
jgi:excisionase family DNA binding protein